MIDATGSLDRSGAPSKKTVDALAWGSYVLFVSEPERLIELAAARSSLS
ncbi:hypothetical protein IHQ68_17910 [Chelatococcus sambhunathii]|uniref:Uncharacterized protein n=1 Tax=Chelatococcus sambhunathii TaxID=363953 RepID=A0ABU1DK54_9HYPH|nr:hypothetical protein [Chelatococcus sambhunathii]MDR4308498.1 hypothetical protein [Chelatococcus sambhunathii]